MATPWSVALPMAQWWVGALPCLVVVLRRDKQTTWHLDHLRRATLKMPREEGLKLEVAEVIAAEIRVVEVTVEEVLTDQPTNDLTQLTLTQLRDHSCTLVKLSNSSCWQLEKARSIWKTYRTRLSWWTTWLCKHRWAEVRVGQTANPFINHSDNRLSQPATVGETLATQEAETLTILSQHMENLSMEGWEILQASQTTPSWKRWMKRKLTT